MATNGTKTRQAKMIAALLDPQNRNQLAACKAAGIPSRTLQNWLADDREFVAALREAETELLDDVLRRLLSLSPAAVAVIVASMANQDAPASTRLRAAQMVIDNLVRLREMHVTDARLTELERQLSVIDAQL